MDLVPLTIRADADCSVYCNGNLWFTLEAGVLKKTQAPAGQLLLEFRAIDDDCVVVKKEVNFTDRKKNYLVIVRELTSLLEQTDKYTNKDKSVKEDVFDFEIDTSFIDENEKSIKELVFQDIDVAPQLADEKDLSWFNDDEIRKAEEEWRLSEENSKRLEEENARREAEEEAKRKAEEEARRKAEAEAKRKAEEMAKQRAEEEARNAVLKSIDFIKEYVITYSGDRTYDILLGRLDENDFKEIVNNQIKPAANLNNASAQFVLGVASEYGIGIQQNMFLAAQCYRKAAELGIDKAQYKLGECYEYGRGILKSYPQAVKWYRKANELNNFPAYYRLNELGE